MKLRLLFICLCVAFIGTAFGDNVTIEEAPSEPPTYSAEEKDIDEEPVPETKTDRKFPYCITNFQIRLIRLVI